MESIITLFLAGFAFWCLCSFVNWACTVARKKAKDKNGASWQAELFDFKAKCFKQFIYGLIIFSFFAEPIQMFFVSVFSLFLPLNAVLSLGIVYFLLQTGRNYKQLKERLKTEQTEKKNREKEQREIAVHKQTLRDEEKKEKEEAEHRANVLELQKFDALVSRIIEHPHMIVHAIDAQYARKQLIYKVYKGEEEPLSSKEITALVEEKALKIENPEVYEYRQKMKLSNY